MSKGITKSEAVQLNEFRERTLASYRKAAEKEGCKSLAFRLLGTIEYLIDSDYSDRLVREKTKVAVEVYDTIMDDTTLPWEVK